MSRTQKNVNFYQLADSVSTFKVAHYRELKIVNFLGRKPRLTAVGAVLCLVGFDAIADTLRVGFAMTVAGDGIGAAGRFDLNLRTER